MFAEHPVGKWHSGKRRAKDHIRGLQSIHEKVCGSGDALGGSGRTFNCPRMYLEEAMSTEEDGKRLASLSSPKRSKQRSIDVKREG